MVTFPKKFRLPTAASVSAIILLAGCAQQPKQPTEAESIHSQYPDSAALAVPSDPGERVVAIGVRQPLHDVHEDVYQDSDSSDVRVMRTSRYQLVSATATAGQRELLEQTVDVSIPANVDASVEDALRYTLDRTGYSLCAPQGRPQELLYSRPLPAAHYRLGPMPLREALQVLAGNAFELQSDPIARTVCYQVRNQRVSSQ